MKKEEIINELLLRLKESFNEKQKLDNQYVVAYFKKDSDELIGYHLDTFCSIGKDILKAKRYSGENPYSQLAIIWRNYESLFRECSEGMFSVIIKKNREAFESNTPDKVYIDAIYLAKDTPVQNFRYQIIK